MASGYFIILVWECAQREIESMENSAEKDKLRPKRPVPPRPKANQLIKAGITPSSADIKQEAGILVIRGGFMYLFTNIPNLMQILKKIYFN